MGSDPNANPVGGLMKNIGEQEGGSGSISSSLMDGRDVGEGNNPMYGESDMTRVHDFLGVGGSTSRAPNLQDFHSGITNNGDWSWKHL